MPVFESIRKNIMASPLQGDEKMKLIDIFAELSSDHLESISKFIEKDPAVIVKMGANLKRKAEAFATGNRELLSQIIADEKKYIEDLTFDLD